MATGPGQESAGPSASRSG